MKTYKTIIWICLLGFSGCASEPRVDEVQQWGPERIEAAPEPFRMPPKGTSLARRRRIYERHRMALGYDCLLVGHQACTLEQAEAYLEASGAGAQSAGLKKVGRHEKALDTAGKIARFGTLSVVLTAVTLKILNDARGRGKFPAPPRPPLPPVVPPHVALGAPVAVEGARQAEFYTRLAMDEAVMKSMADFNRRLAAALGLRPGIDVYAGADPRLPPPIDLLDLSDLAPGERWRDYEADYRVSLRGGGWFIGEAPVSAERLSIWYADMGYNEAASALLRRDRMGRPIATTEQTERVAEANARIPIQLEIRVKAANPGLFPHAEDPSMPAKQRKNGAPGSARSMDEQ